MKNRITFVAENSKQIPKKYSIEEYESFLKIVWQEFLNSLATELDEKATVEKVEVFE